MVEIIPAILAETKEKFVEMVKKIEPYTERVHLDIMDSAFTPGKTIMGYQELQELETKLQFDVHLMVMHPSEYLPQWLLKTKADRFFLHAESEGDFRDLCSQIHVQGKKAGIVLNPETLVGSVLEYLPVVDYIQFMTVHPGAYSQPFLNDMVEKILDFHETHEDIPIVVDGGINVDTAWRAVGAGARSLVVGSYIMNSPDPALAIAELKGRFPQ